MTLANKNWSIPFTTSLFLISALLFAVACAPAGGRVPSLEETEAAHDEDTGHDHQGEHDHGHSHTSGRIPNEGAVIRIVSPAEGATFQAGEQIIVEIETEKFQLGEEGNHWHVYVDDSSWGMVMGQNRSEILSGVEPGEHEISVYLSIGTHEELEEGDSITVTIDE